MGEYTKMKSVLRFLDEACQVREGVGPVPQGDPVMPDMDKLRRDLHEGALDAIYAEQQLRVYLSRGSVIYGLDSLKFDLEKPLAAARAYVASLEHLRHVENRAIDQGVWG